MKTDLYSSKLYHIAPLGEIWRVINLSRCAGLKSSLKDNEKLNLVLKTIFCSKKRIDLSSECIFLIFD